MGRPKIVIDPNIVQGLAEIFCTMEEIASVVGCSVDTLERRFADVIKRGRDTAKGSLRRVQWQTAQKGNATMQIWLGKQYLDQKDGQEMEGQDEERLNRLLAVANATMVHLAGAGSATSGNN